MLIVTEIVDMHQHLVSVHRTAVFSARNEYVPRKMLIVRHHKAVAARFFIRSYDVKRSSFKHLEYLPFAASALLSLGGDDKLDRIVVQRTAGVLSGNIYIVLFAFDTNKAEALLRAHKFTDQRGILRPAVFTLLG